MRGTTPGVEAAARQLRRGMTPAERVLWAALRDRQLAGLKFRRQHAVGPFVLDFYCPASRLVVELDGGVHDGQVEQDQARTEHLTGYGYRVLRFRNEEVLGDLEAVLGQIAAAGLPEARVAGEVGCVAPDALDPKDALPPT
jgi:very-short-patch-repair endonuclease